MGRARRKEEIRIRPTRDGRFMYRGYEIKREADGWYATYPGSDSPIMVGDRIYYDSGNDVGRAIRREISEGMVSLTKNDRSRAIMDIVQAMEDGEVKSIYDRIKKFRDGILSEAAKERESRYSAALVQASVSPSKAESRSHLRTRAQSHVPRSEAL
jgi:hypothetical protein